MDVIDLVVGSRVATLQKIDFKGVAELFDHVVAEKIISLIETINHNAEAA